MSHLEKLLAESEGLKPCAFCNKEPLDDGMVEGDDDFCSCINEDCPVDCKSFLKTDWQKRPREEKLARICRELLKASQEIIKGVDKRHKTDDKYTSPWKELTKLIKAIERANEIAKE